MPDVIAIDVETHCFRPYHMAPRVVCLSYAQKDGDAVRSGVLAGDEIEPFLDEHLGRSLLVGHVVAYDMACILATYPRLWDRVWTAYADDLVCCTAIREKLIDISQGDFRFGDDENGDRKKIGYDLADIVRRRLKGSMSKGLDTWRTRYADLEGVPIADWPRDAIDYSELDAKMALLLYRNQERRTVGKYTLPTQYDDTRADFALRLMSVWGVCTDGPRVRELLDGLTCRLSALGVEIEKSGLARGTRASPLPGMDFSPELKKSMVAIRDAVERYYPGDPPRTEKGQIQTGKEVLGACNYPPFEALIEYNSIQKEISTYLEKMVEPIVHASFFGIGAASLRTSCRRPNLQNQPRTPGIRECFIPRPGCVFLACDFDCQEMRTLAQSCLDLVGRSRLAERFQADRHFDPHFEFARELAELAGSADAGAYRQRAKACNFGYPGGMGPDSFVSYARGYGLEITSEQSAALRDVWLRTWPEMPVFFRHVSSLVQGSDYAAVIIPQTGFVRAGCGYTDASNTYFQSLAASASKAALWEVSRRCYADRGSYLYGSRPVLFVHDEIIMETPEEAVADAADELEAVMVSAMECFTPDVPAAASATAMRRWSKKAQRVEDESGQLVVWEEL